MTRTGIPAAGICPKNSAARIQPAAGIYFYGRMSPRFFMVHNLSLNHTNTLYSV